MKTNELLLRMLDGERPNGRAIRGVARFDLNGEPCTAQIKALVRSGFVDLFWAHGGDVGANLTDAGRKMKAA